MSQQGQYPTRRCSYSQFPGLPGNQRPLDPLPSLAGPVPLTAISKVA